MTSSIRSKARAVYYRDLFLFWPFLMSAWGASLLFSHSPDDKSKGVTCAGIASLVLVVARRRLALVVGVVTFIASMFVTSLLRPTDWRVNISMYLVGGVVLWAIGRLHQSKSFRRMLHDELHEFSSDEPTMTDLVVNLSGLLSILVVFYYLGRILHW